MAELRITQIKSGVGGKDYQRATLRTLGSRCIGQTVVCEDRPKVLGMTRTVAYLVGVEEVE